MSIHDAIKYGTKNNIRTATPTQQADKPSQPKPNQQDPKPSMPDVVLAQDTKSTPTAVDAEATKTPEPKPTPTPQTADKVATTSPSFKTVDLNIAGTSHRINCPADEVAQLERAGNFINDKIREIRHETKAKGLSNEELLVLICLELYDSQESLRVERRNQLNDNEQARALIEKINKEARSVL